MDLYSRFVISIQSWHAIEEKKKEKKKKTRVGRFRSSCSPPPERNKLLKFPNFLEIIRSLVERGVRGEGRGREGEEGKIIGKKSIDLLYHLHIFHTFPCFYTS